MLKRLCGLESGWLMMLQGTQRLHLLLTIDFSFAPFVLVWIFLHAGLVVWPWWLVRRWLVEKNRLRELWRLIVAAHAIGALLTAVGVASICFLYGSVICRELLLSVFASQHVLMKVSLVFLAVSAAIGLLLVVTVHGV